MRFPVAAQTSALPAVLVVDDDPLSRSLLTALLQRHDAACEIVTAIDGAEALNRLEEQAFQLIITDNQMPQLSGLELTAIVKRRWPETPVMLISGDMPNSVERRAREQGVDYCLPKPFPIQRLRAILSLVLPALVAEQILSAASNQ